MKRLVTILIIVMAAYTYYSIVRTISGTQKTEIIQKHLDSTKTVFDQDGNMIVKKYYSSK